MLSFPELQSFGSTFCCIYTPLHGSIVHMSPLGMTSSISNPLTSNLPSLIHSGKLYDISGTCGMLHCLRKQQVPLISSGSPRGDRYEDCFQGETKENIPCGCCGDAERQGTLVGCQFLLHREGRAELPFKTQLLAPERKRTCFGTTGICMALSRCKNDGHTMGLCPLSYVDLKSPTGYISISDCWL